MDTALTMLLVAVLAGVAGPIVVAAAVMFGICDPINLDIGNRTIRFEALPLFARKRPQYQSIQFASATIGITKQYDFVTTAMATILCAPLLLNELPPFKAGYHTAFSAQVLTTGTFVEPNA